jgi:hypothetical protein
VSPTPSRGAVNIRSGLGFGFSPRPQKQGMCGAAITCKAKQTTIVKLRENAQDMAARLSLGSGYTHMRYRPYLGIGLSRTAGVIFCIQSLDPQYLQ